MTKFELPEKPKKTNTSEDFYNLRKAVDELDKFDYAWKTHANKADRRINAANKYIEELERENQSLKADYNNQAESILLMLEEISTLKSQLQQQALPVVPECVAEYIKTKLDKSKNLQDLYDEPLFHTGEVYLSGSEYNFISWFNENTTLFEKAWTIGYTVEKPQLFKLIFPNSSTVLQKDGELNSFADTVYKRYLIENAMTEQEIKSIDERYWQFAVPVEDGE